MIWVCVSLNYSIRATSDEVYGISFHRVKFHFPNELLLNLKSMNPFTVIAFPVIQSLRFVSHTTNDSTAVLSCTIIMHNYLINISSKFGWNKMISHQIYEIIMKYIHILYIYMIYICTSHDSTYVVPSENYSCYKVRSETSTKSEKRWKHSINMQLKLINQQRSGSHEHSNTWAWFNLSLSTTLMCWYLAVLI